MVTIKKLQYIFFGFVVLLCFGMIALYFFWDPSQTALFPKCPFYNITGLYCPGCGSQRAAHDLIHGHFIEGFSHNYLILLLIVVLSYKVYALISQHLLKKPLKDNLLHKSKVTNSILIVVILFWIFRNLPWFPFTLLAP